MNDYIYIYIYIHIHMYVWQVLMCPVSQTYSVITDSLAHVRRTAGPPVNYIISCYTI